jgi:hypothetical protein
VFDALLNLLPVTTNISGAGTTTPVATGKYLGRNRTYRAWGRCAGDVTGTLPTLTINLLESTTLAMGTPTAIPGSLVITEQIGGGGGASAGRVSPEIPSSVQTLPSLVFTTTKDYVQAQVVAGGTAPVFPGVSVVIEPIDAPTLPSGR